MTATKKSMRFLTVFALIFAMVLSMTSIPASAAGVETWGASDYYIFEDPFTIRGYNLTPVKTMGTSGTLFIHITAMELLDTSTNPMKFKYEIRSNGTVLSSYTYYWSPGDLPCSCVDSVQVSAGQKIQLYISAYDTVTGNYRTVQVKYGRWLS